MKNNNLKTRAKIALILALSAIAMFAMTISAWATGGPRG